VLSTKTGGISAYHRESPIRKIGIPYTKPKEEIAPSPPPSFKKNPAKDELVRTTPIVKTIRGSEKPLISKGTVSLKDTPSGKFPVGLFATPFLASRPHLIVIAFLEVTLVLTVARLGPLKPVTDDVASTIHKHDKIVEPLNILIVIFWVSSGDVQGYNTAKKIQSKMEM
jgi:hypothetical protein